MTKDSMKLSHVAVALSLAVVLWGGTLAVCGLVPGPAVPFLAAVTVVSLIIFGLLVAGARGRWWVVLLVVILPHFFF